MLLKPYYIFLLYMFCVFQKATTAIVLLFMDERGKN